MAIKSDEFLSEYDGRKEFFLLCVYGEYIYFFSAHFLSVCSVFAFQPKERLAIDRKNSKEKHIECAKLQDM